MEVDAVRSIAWVLFFVSGLYLMGVIVLGVFEDGQLPVVLITWVLAAAAFILLALSPRQAGTK